MRQAHRFSGAGKPYEGLTTIRKGKVDWSGVARFIPSELDAPLRWKKPERIFVNSMSDLFHHSLTDAEIMRVWMVMGRCPQHEFLVLTKRPERARSWLERWSDAGTGDPLLARGPAEIRARHTEGRALMFAEVLDGMGEPPPGAAFPTYDWMEGVRWWPNALPNVWLGVSCENQETADERIPLLLNCPAAIRWLSCEPLLGPINLDPGVLGCKGHLAETFGNPLINWVVVGGESGPRARPMEVDWVRSLVTQCRDASVPLFVKQWGDRPSLDPDERSDADKATARTRHRRAGGVGFPYPQDEWRLFMPALRLKKRKGGDLSEIPGDWPREFPT